MIFWSFLSVAAGIVILRKVKDAKKASTAERKLFHLFAIAVYLPGLLYHCTFLYLASGVVLGVFFVLEVILYNLPVFCVYI